MLDVEQIKKLLNNPRLSDKEVEVIRDDLYGLAQIIFEKLKRDKARQKQINKK